MLQSSPLAKTCWCEENEEKNGYFKSLDLDSCVRCCCCCCRVFAILNQDESLSKEKLASVILSDPQFTASSN